MNRIGKIITCLLIFFISTLNAQRIFEGDVYYADGTTSMPDVGSINAAFTSGKTPIGVVYYVDTTGQYGWVVALHDANNGLPCKWENESGNPGRCVDVIGIQNTNIRKAIEDVNGYVNTAMVMNLGSNWATQWPAFGVACYNNDTVANGNWFLPAAGQLQLLYSNMNVMSSTITNLKNSYFGTSIASEMGGYQYWTSSEESNSNAWSICGDGVLTSSRSYIDSKITDHYVRSICHVNFSKTDHLIVRHPDGTSDSSFYKVGQKVILSDNSEGIVFYTPAIGEDLAVSMSDLIGSYKWATDTGFLELTPVDMYEVPIASNIYMGPWNEFLPGVKDMNGYENTRTIRQNMSTTHPAASMVDFSKGWYIPSSGELIKLGVRQNVGLNGIKANLKDSVIGHVTRNYYTSTMISRSKVWILTIDTSLTWYGKWQKTDTCGVRPIHGVSARFYHGDTLSVVVTPGTSIQWFKDETAIFGATTDKYVPTSAGAYYVIATNGSISQRSKTQRVLGVDTLQYLVDVKSNDTTMGIVMGGGIYPINTQVVLTAVAKPNGQFVMWSDGITPNPRTISVTKDTMFTAIFKGNGYYTITTNVNDTSFGEVLGGGIYSYLDTTTLIAIPKGGYSFAIWSDGVTQNPRAITVLGNATYTAYFACTGTYIIDARANDSTLGTVTGGGVYNNGDTVMLNAIPHQGCEFVKWNDGDTLSSRMIIVNNNAVYIAEFTNMFGIDTCVISAIANDSIYGTVVGGGVYYKYDTILLTAIPNNGYQFIQWNDGNTQNPRTIVVTNSMTYIANFAPTIENSHVVTLSVNNSNYGKVSGEGVYAHNSQAVLTATPYYGYHFVRWDDGNIKNPRTLIVVEDVSYVAYFGINQYNIEAIPYDTNQGIVLGSGIYNYNTQVTLRAEAKDNYHFVQWNDGSTQNPYTITVTDDASYIANFAYNVNIEEATIDGVQVYPNPTMGILEVNKEYVQQIEIFDVNGQALMLFTNKNIVDISQLPSGIYYSRITLPQGVCVKKIVKQ